jgi:hypothetical protein
MNKKYRDVANQLFNEKVVILFPDWTVEDTNISTGKVTLSNEGIVISLLYNGESNHFVIGTITIEPSQITVVTNDRLVEICQKIKEGELG